MSSAGTPLRTTLRSSATGARSFQNGAVERALAAELDLGVEARVERGEPAGADHAADEVRSGSAPGLSGAARTMLDAKGRPDRGEQDVGDAAAEGQVAVEVEAGR